VTSIQATACSWNIAVGNFFFRYRNALFPVLFLLTALMFRPKILLGSPALHRLVIVLGLMTAALGESLRLMTIGWEYIHRGGKDGKVYASRLVKGGMYGTTRNPMYVANALIAIGMTLATSSPKAYAFIIPFFLFVYQAIIAAEENFLRNKFGVEYEAYCAKVNRVIPSLRLVRESFSGMRYDWRLALRHDLGTITGLAIGFTVLPLWHTYFLKGPGAARLAAMETLVICSLIGLLYAALLYLKKRRLLFFAVANQPEAKAKLRAGAGSP
jgi:protein-S-isoprenylcysteine O-methyltransferase Ste14